MRLQYSIPDLKNKAFSTLSATAREKMYNWLQSLIICDGWALVQSHVAGQHFPINLCAKYSNVSLVLGATYTAYSESAFLFLPQPTPGLFMVQTNLKLIKNPKFLTGRRNMPALCKYRNSVIFQEVVEIMKAGGCVYVAQVRHQWKTFCCM